VEHCVCVKCCTKATWLAGGALWLGGLETTHALSFYVQAAILALLVNLYLSFYPCRQALCAGFVPGFVRQALCAPGVVQAGFTTDLFFLFVRWGARKWHAHACALPRAAYCSHHQHKHQHLCMEYLGVLSNVKYPKV
jgi:hypothetical protein